MCNFGQGIEDRALLRGREESRLSGIKENLENIIINMFKNNFTKEQISLATGVGLEQVSEVIRIKLL